ncbi:transcriptional regulator [Grimontia hollisae]|uniref:Sigma factor RpoE regulatory protein RseC n=1 Tax=Grimontia hollisae CIP 101886 TaxID=675812 RepID=D0I4M3_GRIHO|nr:SoxR reducing system RseC family protein [Grimontia hollisae]AMG30149.1 transcriptional regulator [Grimontia hollisae]EEY73440.1 sigma factor RpoE regulatory protein RseC [Grimontia hollisae CIP 101886]MDF2184546.1 SoxR reducing system RseC family protein [Grimontia hollisae]STO42612.1 Sigma-E factor regulatory protein rseC [Grimontia hollisae]STQ77457.1 Sigma-E factor regulatory protein rseC [Grimontia hollisae]
MITALAEVTGSGDGYLTVRCQQKTSCGSCASKNTCGTGIVSNALPGKVMDIRVPSEKAIAAGTLVEIGLEEQTILKSAVVVYILPLVFAVSGAFLGQILADLMAAGEGVIILSSLLAGVLGVVVARCFSRKLEQEIGTTPKLLRVLGNAMNTATLINAATEDSD